MAEYKRKQRKGFKSPPKMNKKKVKAKQEFNDIEMRPQNAPKPQKMRVVKGKKLEQKRRFKFVSYVIGAVACVLIACELILPAGLSDTVLNYTAVLGTGKYPIELDSSDTINVLHKNMYYYVLTDTKLYAVSNSGKVIYSYAHRFENPILKASKTRALLFDQGNSNVLIFNLKGLKSEITSKEKVLNATIGEDGSYALVTTADNYACSVKVYKKSNKLVYEWFSSEDMVNNVAISPNGKKIAVSAMSSQVGNYDSKISILNFKSANAEYSKEFKNTIIYSMDNVNFGGFAVVSENSYDFISWKGKNSSQYSNEYSVNMLRNCPSGTVIVFNRESDKTDNRIAVFSKNGKMKYQMEYSGIITDIALKGNNVYCLSDTNIFILDTKGNIVRQENAGFGVSRISITSQNKVAVITDNVISEIKLK